MDDVAKLHARCRVLSRLVFLQTGVLDSFFAATLGTRSGDWEIVLREMALDAFIAAPPEADLPHGEPALVEQLNFVLPAREGEPSEALARWDQAMRDYARRRR